MKKCILFFISVMLMSFSTSYASEKIVIAGDSWCPFNCDEESSNKGYMVEIAQAVFSAKGYDVEYRVLPWVRALKLCRSGKIDGVIGAYKEDAPDFIFPEVELGMVGFSAFVRIDDSWEYKGINSLSSMVLGVISGYAYSDEVNGYIDANHKKMNKIQLMSGDSALENNIKKLEAGRIDVTIEADSVFWYTASQLGIKSKFKKAGLIIEPEQAYIAFSPALDSSSDFAKILSQGIVSLRASGQMQKILDKYGLSDWK